MKLEDVRAEIRPRVPWESIDLGCTIARNHIGALWRSWFVTVVPLWVVLAVLLRNHPFWFIVAVWWLKPLYDRILLFVVSRALFGEVPHVKSVLKAWPRILVKNFFTSLFLRRFSPSRSLTLPVSELEGLKGKRYRQRIRLLEVNGGEGAAMATCVGLLLENVALLGTVLFVFSMVPTEVSELWWLGLEEFFSQDDFSSMSNGFFWTWAVIWMVAITLMEPFYVSAGFALYVNSRTLTEGWDIELAFKRMSVRINKLNKGIKKAASIFVLGLVLSLPILAVNSVIAASEVTGIEEILNDDDFIVFKKLEKVPVEKDDFFDWDFPAIPSFVGTIIFYLILVAFFAGLIYLLYQNRHLFGVKRGLKLQLPERQVKAREIMGMNVSPESLPNDIVGAARDAWALGNHQLALSFLYRGSIAFLVNRVELPIQESDTEGDCLRRVEMMTNDEITPYFKSLTQVWIAMAYGKKQPDELRMQALCDAWPFHSDAKIAKGGGIL
ncbi:MAG: DUF4129 domain-containing protein [Akkermansiaceae bacterium]